ncbi:hypothetical protein TURU_163696 [Turdus rufiventris]|nr:hypothetical protein TURU_163696 [Turdus rufiventris]
MSALLLALAMLWGLPPVAEVLAETARGGGNSESLEHAKLNVCERQESLLLALATRRGSLPAWKLHLFRFLAKNSPSSTTPQARHSRLRIASSSPCMSLSQSFDRIERSVDIMDVIILDELWLSLLSVSADGALMDLGSIASTEIASLAGQSPMPGTLVLGS